ncbi:MAG: hypothetical protein HYU66_09235 [Armatimonadetes bacterium]|nr:hypothetical protein [Armatimonadota bacterium]
MLHHELATALQAGGHVDVAPGLAVVAQVLARLRLRGSARDQHEVSRELDGVGLRPAGRVALRVPRRVVHLRVIEQRGAEAGVGLEGDAALPRRLVVHRLEDQDGPGLGHVVASDANARGEVGDLDAGAIVPAAAEGVANGRVEAEEAALARRRPAGERERRVDLVETGEPLVERLAVRPGHLLQARGGGVTVAPAVAVLVEAGHIGRPALLGKDRLELPRGKELGSELHVVGHAGHGAQLLLGAENLP